MLSTTMEMLSYPFLQRALIVGILVSLCSALLGTSLVLKRYSMIGDGLSHVGFSALAIAYAVGAAPITVSIPVCIIAAFLLLRMNENSRITPGIHCQVVTLFFGDQTLVKLLRNQSSLSITFSHKLRDFIKVNIVGHTC